MPRLLPRPKRNRSVASLEKFIYRQDAGLLPRGMSIRHDTVNWRGWYPYEFEKPEEIFDFFRKRGFEMVRLTTYIGGLGCNEYVFAKDRLNPPVWGGV